MMATKAIKSVGKTVSNKALGFGPGPIRAAVAAAITGTAAAVGTYKLLRSDVLGGGED